MPVQVSYPGVYIEEVPSGVRTIAGVSTSDTAFIDFFARGPINRPARITGFADFERVFGGLDRRSEASYAIRQFFLNGGSIAWVVRVVSDEAQPASAVVLGGSPEDEVLEVAAASPGVWGNNLRVSIERSPRDPERFFNLTAREVITVNGREKVLASETYLNLSMDLTSSRYAIEVVNGASSLISLNRLSDEDIGVLPNPVTDARLGTSDETAGSDGDEPGSSDWETSGPAALTGSAAEKTGLFALETIAPFIFNLLCIPAAAELPAEAFSQLISDATAFCEKNRAFLLVDIPPDVATVSQMGAWMAANDGLRSNSAAVYFPRLSVPDLLNENRPRNVAASGTMAGVYARTDATRGVWKAPAGTDADLRGANVLVSMTDLENGGLNPLGINALRRFPVVGPVAWGARTMDGADQLASEWKYIPVRRMALFIEESLFQGLKWVVFEPNDEPLWAQIRLNVGAFMQNLFRQGAFQGTTPRDAYFVKCDKETTTQTDINLGIVNIMVGFAPLKPAEFVIIRLQQMAGQIAV